MVDALKKLDRKFLIIAGVIVASPIILIIFLAIIRGCSNSRMTYENYEKKMLSATEKYFKDKMPTDEAELKKVSLDKLVEKKLIKNPEKALKDNCKGEVTVRRNGSSISTTEGGFLNYTVNLECDNYKTTKLVDKITSEIVESESGLYKTSDGYIFKGNKVKNYLNLLGVSYRIMSVDSNGILKLVKSEPEIATRMWDNKYNTEINTTAGKTIYKDSVILSYLIADYKNPKRINKKTKAHVVAYDTCIGKRASDDYSISKEKDCSEVLEKQVISLMTISDFAMASADLECNSTTSRSCRNYNYLFDVASATWTSNSVTDNTYEALYISDGLQGSQRANTYNAYNYVIYIDGNEMYQGGEGTEESPYIIN